MAFDQSSLTSKEKSLEETFYELRSWVNERLKAKGVLPPSLPQTRGEPSGITVADLDRLKEDIAALIKLEGRRSFWSGFGVNALFFVLGLVAGLFI
jgi:hypothetical protein